MVVRKRNCGLFHQRFLQNSCALSCTHKSDIIVVIFSGKEKPGQFELLFSVAASVIHLPHVSGNAQEIVDPRSSRAVSSTDPKKIARRNLFSHISMLSQYHCSIFSDDYSDRCPCVNTTKGRPVQNPESGKYPTTPHTISSRTRYYQPVLDSKLGEITRA